MNQPVMPQSKLYIRSEVLAVIDFIAAVESPSKQDKLKQIKRLRQIENRRAVLDILVKELERSKTEGIQQAIAELLMELGTIEDLQDTLWGMIRHPDASDEVKDVANLVLRHLGDEADPELYLEFLEDPVGLISRETERMLEVSAQNPEALIDFIDFILSLPQEEQCNLVSSLHSDYKPEYLLNLYMPMVLSDISEDLRGMILYNLGQIRTPRAALFLHDTQGYFALSEENTRLVKKSLNELRMAGVYREQEMDTLRQELVSTHTLPEETKFHQCFATLPDGIGNQGLIVSRIRPNGDIVMFSVALSDVHGVIDCFGFYQLSEEDFGKIVEKFHEESTKIKVSPEYCQFKLAMAEHLNLSNRFRIPYEYTCWKTVMEDVSREGIDVFEFCEQHANKEWEGATEGLYRHPDFQTWFLDDEDHPVMEPILGALKTTTYEAAASQLSAESFTAQMDDLVENMIKQLMGSSWREFLVQRVADAAYLLGCQASNTFSTLAATEAVTLVTHRDTPGESFPITGFLRQYGRRCVEEYLLRIRLEKEAPKDLTPMLEKLMEAWCID